ncbi:hypothetical protein CGLO_06159 [Colletotrichum gloeosporioides Cg-14]|uniref:Transcription factor domain-containing protein n=1 Tax=Colletotrichum gloeosporioides (strain Cg-14) TaxID=1237896 RepID=T0KQ17_COLGC|nr:hypothetical protein CGLO_06159 [Colletotrichum gloeosporioides Cg-14]
MFGMDMDSLDTVLVDIKQLPISILLVLSIALRSADNSPLNLGPELLLALSEASFTNALQSQWTLLSVVDEERIPLSLLMAYCLMYFWARPFHALGLVQSLDPVIRTFSMRNGDEFLGRLYYRLHYIIECDILTEVDGIPSDKTFEVLTKTNDESMSGFLESHLWLRSHLNKVLQYLYSTSKAYAQPHELADLVCNLSADLRGWFQSQPLGAQFARDATAFSMSVPSMPLRKREIALRYFACAFLLHRPVLYFFLHKDMEYTVRPPDTQALRSDQAPWILESCRDCIEGATLFVHFSCISMDSQSSKMERSYRSWCDIQLLFAAYLVLVQVKSVPALVPIFRVLGDVENLLDQAERMFELFPVDSLKIRKSLEVLRSQRQNLDAASPVYSHGSV